MLFFAVCFLLYLTKSVTDLAGIFAWVFSITRIIHAGVHLSFNHIMTRFLVFFAGGIALTGLVVIAALAVF